MSIARNVGFFIGFCLLVFSAKYGKAADNDGARIFAARCAGCHLLDGSGNIKGPAIARQPSTIARSDKDLFPIVRNGIPGKGMPAMKQLSNAQIIAVVKHLRTLQQASPLGSPGSGSAAGAGDPKATGKDLAEARAAAQATGEMLAMKEAPGVDLAGLRSFHVDESDLNQKQVEENWVSYNGDYTGRRFSAMSEVTPANFIEACELLDQESHPASYRSLVPLQL
jgi:alcohol dehydrogenase (cytochrome c)